LLKLPIPYFEHLKFGSGIRTQNFQISESVAGVEFHVNNFHPMPSPLQQPPPPQQPQQLQTAAVNGSHDDDLPLGATYETANSAKFGNGANAFNSGSAAGGGGGSNAGAHHDLSPSDPKGVELDNAGRVKSGKVRKQGSILQNSISAEKFWGYFFILKGHISARKQQLSGYHGQ
jgi:hypothetical protein